MISEYGKTHIGSQSGPHTTAICMWHDKRVMCREQLEHCDAALCPSVAYQLSGAKKVQQDLARPQVLDRFLDDKEQVDLIRACFAGTRPSFRGTARVANCYVRTAVAACNVAPDLFEVIIKS